MERIMRDDITSFQIKERSHLLPNCIQLGTRVSQATKVRLTTHSMSQGVSEAQLFRFLIMQGLERYGIDGFQAK